MSTSADASESLAAPAAILFWEAFMFWLKLGFISFGGPAGQISIMHQELVERRRWISKGRFLHALNFCIVLPGPEAQQLATYIGWLMHRTRGGVVAGALFVRPSLLILIVLSWTYIAFGEVPLVAGLFYGVKPAVTAIVLQAAHRIGARALRNRVLWGIAGAAFVAIFAANVPFPLVVIAAAIAGYIGGRVAPGRFSAGGGHEKAGTVRGASLIDDDTPTPPHAMFRWSRNAAVAVVALMTVHAGLLAAIWRSWRKVLSWRRAAVALCMSAAFLPIGALMALHAPPPVSAYFLWLLGVTAIVGLVALWRIACAAATTFKKRQLSTDD